MCRKKADRILLILTTAILSVSMISCSTSTRNEQVNEELVAFMLDHIVMNYVDVRIAASASGDQAEQGANPVPSLIIWAPQGKDAHSPGEILDLENPIKVWMYTGHQLSEVSDPATAIEQYKNEYIQYPETESWGFYNFGIFSVSRDAQQAEVYLGISCGPMCGIGYLYTLQCNTSAGWEITDTELVWIV